MLLFTCIALSSTASAKAAVFAPIMQQDQGAGQPANSQAMPIQIQLAQGKTTSATGPSAILQPSLDIANQIVGSLRIEKWKGGSVRAEAMTNISSIQRDLKGNLPALLADADADPTNMSKLLMVSRNVNALYDVLLRVYDAARVAAPGEQISQLEEAMSGVDKARRNLDDTIRDLAVTKENQFATLQIALKTQATPVCPAPPPPPAATPTAKKRVVKKKPQPPASKAPPNSQTNPQVGSSAKPNGN